jgi:hypothetical protein
MYGCEGMKNTRGTIITDNNYVRVNSRRLLTPEHEDKCTDVKV